MSTGLYSHTTRATGTVLTAVIYNGDHTNHITNQNPQMTGAYSDNAAQMQSAANPGGVGTESLATSLAGEIERLRYVLKTLHGGAQWYPGVALVAASGGTLTNPANTTQPLVDGATIAWDMSLGANGTVTLAGSRTLAAPTNIKVGGRYILEITQDGTGSRGLTFNAVFRGLGGQSCPQPYSAAASRTVYTFFSPDGTNLDLEGSQVNLLVLTNSLAADVNLNNTGLFFDGPSVAQGIVGTWEASGNISAFDGTGSGGGYAIIAKLWDGTTVIASTRVDSPTGFYTSLHLSGKITSPAGNIRISVQDISSTAGLVKANITGLGKDSTITVKRIG